MNELYVHVYSQKVANKLNKRYNRKIVTDRFTMSNRNIIEIITQFRNASSHHIIV